MIEVHDALCDVLRKKEMAMVDSDSQADMSVIGHGLENIRQSINTIINNIPGYTDDDDICPDCKGTCDDGS